MEKELAKNKFVIGLVIITLLSLLSLVFTLKQKYDLAVNLNKAKIEISGLIKEKQNLLTSLEKEKELNLKLSFEKSELKGYLKAGKSRLSRLFSAYSVSQSELEQLSSKFGLLKAENVSLREEKQRLSKENEILQTRLSSVAELRKAIRELKLQAHKVVRKVQEKAREDTNIEGNHGFISKNDAKINSPVKVKIEVIPAQKNE
ncbi:MAG: hypothetical protein HZC15_06690 [Candidatus Omnitrophica bacterium]|nr:hypothetical protein [Candidatus Omnitrophota bacterium]